MDEPLATHLFPYQLVQDRIRERVASLAAEDVFFTFIRSENYGVAVAFATRGKALFDHFASYGVSAHPDRNIT